MLPNVGSEKPLERLLTRADISTDEEGPAWVGGTGSYDMAYVSISSISGDRSRDG